MAQKPKHDEDGTMCPKWQDLCSNRCHTCKFWRSYPVTLPDNTKDVHWDCSLAFAGQVELQAVGMQAETVKAVQQLRNMTVAMSKIALGAQYHDDPETLAATMNAVKLLELADHARSLPQR